MPIIDRKQLKNFLKKKLTQTDTYCLKIMTFKKDRYISIQYLNRKYCIREVGFKHHVFHSDTAKDTLHLVLKCAKLEFPRSNKLYVIYECR